MTATEDLESRLGSLPGAMHISVRPQNEHELANIHGSAESSALYYVAVIVALYVFSLLVVVVHYMNNYYGSWAWNADDIWTELRAACCFNLNSNSNNNEGNNTEGNNNVIVGTNEVSLGRQLNVNTEEEEESSSDEDAEQPPAQV